MGKKSLRLGQRIIAIHPRSIDGNIADNRPISGSIIVTNWGSILTKITSFTQCKRFSIPQCFRISSANVVAFNSTELI